MELLSSLRSPLPKLQVGRSSWCSQDSPGAMDLPGRMMVKENQSVNNSVTSSAVSYKLCVQHQEVIQRVRRYLEIAKQYRELPGVTRNNIKNGTTNKEARAVQQWRINGCQDVTTKPESCVANAIMSEISTCKRRQKYCNWERQTILHQESDWHWLLALKFADGQGVAILAIKMSYIVSQWLSNWHWVVTLDLEIWETCLKDAHKGSAYLVLIKMKFRSPRYALRR